MGSLNNTNDLQDILRNSLKILQKYDWLLNSYVLDFYVNDHWNKLPISWQNFFQNISSVNLAKLLDNKNVNNNNQNDNNKLWPLSIIALKVIINKLSLSRDYYNKINNLNFINDRKFIFEDVKLRKLFFKHVKLKKQHEIIKMSEICYKTARECDVQYIVDFGSGLGHLSRVLAFGYGLNVCCLEQQNDLTKQARIIDEQFEKIAAKYLANNECKDYKRPVHLNIKLTENTLPEHFLNELFNSFDILDRNNINYKIGIIGLHPCGDLAPILLKMFLKIKEVKFINIVGCCYMKLSTNNNKKFTGYPLSNYLNNDLKLISNLNYESLEIACHAIEMYTNKLINENYDHLKIHSYRAAIETIILKHSNKLKHSGLKSVKNKENLKFFDYCKLATENLNISISLDECETKEIDEYLKKWKNVVIFYTLRLMLAPIVETVILIDRLLYLRENNIFCNLETVFDPIISPRNHILIGIKK